LAAKKPGMIKYQHIIGCKWINIDSPLLRNDLYEVYKMGEINKRNFRQIMDLKKGDFLCLYHHFSGQGISFGSFAQYDIEAVFSRFLMILEQGLEKQWNYVWWRKKRVTRRRYSDIKTMPFSLDRMYKFSPAGGIVHRYIAHKKNMTKRKDQKTTQTYFVENKMRCLAVKPRWDLQEGSLKTSLNQLFYLPQKLRRMVLEKLIAYFSPSVRAKGKPNKILWFEKSLQVSGALERWQEVVKNASPELWTKVNPFIEPKTLRSLYCPVLRSGWIYVFYKTQNKLNFTLFKEYQVKSIGVFYTHKAQFSEVDLQSSSGQNKRRSIGVAQDTILLPYLDAQKQPIQTRVCFSETQWSWPRVQALGGLDLVINQQNMLFKAAKKHYKPDSQLQTLRLGNILSFDKIITKALTQIDQEANQNKNMSLFRGEVWQVDQIAPKELPSYSVKENIENRLFYLPNKTPLVEAAGTNQIPRFTLLISDPLGVASLVTAEILFFWNELSQLISRLPTLPDAYGNCHFKSAALGYQLYFNYKAEGLVFEEIKQNGLFGQQVQESYQNPETQSASPLYKAAKYLDKTKIAYQLRVKERAFLKASGRSLQALLVNYLQLDSVVCALSDHFALPISKLGASHARYHGLLSIACLNFNSLDRAYTLDNRFINSSKIKTTVNSSVALSPKNGELIDTRYQDFGDWVLEQTVQTNLLTMRCTCSKKVIAKKQIPGLAYLSNMLQTQSGMFFSLFPKHAVKKNPLQDQLDLKRAFNLGVPRAKETQRVDKRIEKDWIDLNGKGEFFPYGFACLWQQAKPEDQIDSSLAYLAYSADLMQHAIEAYFRLAAMAWESDSQHQASVTKKVALDLLSHAEHPFRDGSIVIGSGRLAGQNSKRYKLLGMKLLGPSQDLKKSEQNEGANNNPSESLESDLHVYVQFDQAGKLVASSHDEDSIRLLESQLVLKPNGSLEMSEKAEKALTTQQVKFLYVKDAFSLNSFLAHGSKGLKGILASLALLDIFSQIVAIKDAKHPWVDLSQLFFDLQNMAQNSKELAESFLGTERVSVFLNQYASSKWLLEEQVFGDFALSPFSAIGLLGLSFTAIDTVVNFIHSFSQDDPALQISSGLNAFGASVLWGHQTARFIMAIQKQRAARLAKLALEQRDFKSKQALAIASEDSKSIQDTGLDLVADTSASSLLDSLVAFIPGFDLVTLGMVLLTIAAQVVLLFRDSKFDTWAKRSPFSKIKDKESFDNPDLLYSALLSLVMHPSLHISSYKKNQLGLTGWTINLSLPMVNLWQKPKFTTQALWQFGDAHPAVDLAAGKPINRPKSIVLLPYKKIIGQQFYYASCETKVQNQAFQLQEALQESQNLGANPAQNQITQSKRSRLLFSVRGQVNFGAYQVPIPIDWGTANPTPAAPNADFNVNPDWVHVSQAVIPVLT
jgi:hypothetical protein